VKAETPKRRDAETECRDLVTGFNRMALPVEPPDRVLLIPWGKVESDGAGGDHLVDDEAARMIMEAFAARKGVPLVIDYEHASEGGRYASPTGVAPAMGWINSLEIERGVGVFGRVEWTEPGAEFVRKKLYRFPSWAGWIDPKSRRVIAIKSVALVNQPGIVGMPPIVNKDTSMDPKFDSARWFLNLEATATEEQIMDELQKFLTQLRELAGVPASADQGAIVAGFKAKLTAAPPAASVAVCKALGVSETAPEADIVAAVNKAREVDPAKFVPAAEQAKLVERLNTVEAALSANKADAFIAGGMKAGKITEATKGMWLGVFKADPAEAAKHLEAAPVIAPKDGRETANAGAPPDGAGERQAIIAKASAEFDANRAKLERLTCKASFVGGELIAAGKAKLTEEEEKKLGS
jgi:phage I-like protein